MSNEQALSLFRYELCKDGVAGVSTSAVLRRAGLDPALVSEPRVLLKTEELFALWRAIGEESRDPAIGLVLGTETRTERFTPTGLAALSCENFGEAVNQIARYKQLTCPEEIVQHKHTGEWSIQFRCFWRRRRNHPY